MRKNIRLYRPSAKRSKIESHSIIPKESVTCKSFVTRFKQEQLYGLIDDEKVLIHIANENITSPAYRLHLYAMGLIPGVPDYICLYKGSAGFIEFKRDAKCKLSKHQQKFFEILKSLNIKCLCTHDIDIAITFCKNL